MCRSQLNSFKSIAFVGLLLCNFRILAFEFEPGVGVGLEYTNNAALTPVNQLEDIIAIGYVGAVLEENDGPLQADIAATLNHHRYTKDTFEDQRYFNLSATVDWEMITNRFTWLLRNYYQQRPIDTTDPNTPDNIQDTNSFVFGANILFPISARQTFTLLPQYSKYHYQFQATDNQQFSLAAIWNYEINSLTNMGLNASVRTIEYDEPLIEGVTFSNISFDLSILRARSNVSTNLGTTYVERDNGQNTAEFAGSLDWLLNLTSRSRIWTNIATGLTDSSEGTLNATVNPDVGDPNRIEVTTDVVRSQVIALGYNRQDGTLDSNLTSELRQLNYSESPNDRRIWNVDATFNYPVTALLRSGFYARYYNTDYTDLDRIDNDYTIGGNLGYQLSRNLNSTIDLKYRNRDSTNEVRSFEEWSVYVSLTYGFGEPLRPTRAGGF